MEKNVKRFINFGFVILIVALLFLSIMHQEHFDAYVFLILFLCESFLTFTISMTWLSALTLFFVMFIDIIVIGTFMMMFENVKLFYNPFSIIIAYALLLLGYYIAKLVKLKKIKKNFKRIVIKNLKLKLIDVLIITFAFSVMLSLMYFIKNRGIMSGNIENGRIEAASGNGIQIYGIQLLIYVIPALYLEFKKKHLGSKAFSILFIVGAISLFVTGFRTPCFRMISLIMAIMIIQGDLKFNKAIIYVGVLMVVILSIGSLRSGSSIDSLYNMFRGHFIIGSINLNHVYRCFPKLTPFQHGYTYLINILMLKPGPDLDFTLWLKETIGLSFAGGGLTPTIIGEFYINFNTIGVYICMFLYGFVLNKIDNWVFKSNSLTIFKVFIMVYSSAVVGGGIANIIVLLIIIVFYCSFIKIFLRNGDYVE